MASKTDQGGEYCHYLANLNGSPIVLDGIKGRSCEDTQELRTLKQHVLARSLSILKKLLHIKWQ